MVSYLPLLSILLPMHVEAVAGPARLTILTATVIAGALAAAGSNVLFGWLSDRTVARGGSRRGWVAVGLVAVALGCAAVALARTPAALVLAVAVFQVGVNAVLAPLLAIMADEIPDAQKGTAAGLLALGNPVASGLVAALLWFDAFSATGRFSLIPVVTAAFVVPLLLTRPRPLDEPPPAAGVRTMRARDLALAWLARLLMQVAGNVLALYLLYYFESVAPGEPAGAVAIRMGHVMTLAFLAPVPIAILAGRWSDRTGRRKPVLLVTACVAALGLLGMAAADSWMPGALAFGVYTIGASVFLALHAAFAMQVLPSPQHRGRDLGILNLTNTLPALAGPLLAWQLATPRDFSVLMLVLAVLALASGLAILPAQGRQ